MVVVVRERRLHLEALEQLRVAVRDLCASGEDPVELLELPDPERGGHVVEAVVVTEAPVQEPRARLEPSLVAQRREQLVLALVVRRDGAALTRRDLLVRIEREHRRVAVRPDGPPFVPRSERLARVLDERETVLAAELQQRIELARVAEDVDCDDRLRPLGDGSLDGGRIEVVRVWIDVREHRCGALVDRAVRRRDERERRRDHLVARAGLGEQLLEARPGRPQREPPAAQRLEHELLVALVDPGSAELNLPCRLSHASARAKFSTGSRHCAHRSVAPFAVSRYAFWISFVISPTPISISSISRIGVTSAAVPHMKTSSAMCRSERIRFFSTTV